MTEAIIAVFCVSEKSAGHQLLIRKAHFHSLARKCAVYFSQCGRLLFQPLLPINLEDVVTSRVLKSRWLWEIWLKWYDGSSWCLSLAALRDPMTMERANLLNMAKLSIKGLIESALSFGRTLDSDYPPLQQFFVVMEHCLKHGLKGKNEVVIGDVRLWFCASVTVFHLISNISPTQSDAGVYSSPFLCPSSKEILSGL